MTRNTMFQKERVGSLKKRVGEEKLSVIWTEERGVKGCESARKYHCQQ